MMFDDLLTIYEQRLSYIQRMIRADNLSLYHTGPEYWDGYFRSTFDWFEDMKLYCDDFNPVMSSATDKEKIKYKYVPRDNDDQGDYDLYGILQYRGEHIPVYYDDYGQQLFAIYKDKIIAGGTYNLSPEYDFSYEIDLIKDNMCSIKE